MKNQNRRFRRFGLFSGVLLSCLSALGTIGLTTTSAKADPSFSTSSNMHMNDDGTSGTGWINFSGNGAITQSLHTSINSWMEQGHTYFNISCSANGVFENNPLAESSYYSFLEDQTQGLRSWSQASIEIPGTDGQFATAWISGYAGLWRDRNPEHPTMTGYGYGQIGADNAIPVSNSSFYQIDADGHWYADGGVTFMVVPAPGVCGLAGLGGLLAFRRRR